jgi:hypothetical protein
MRIRYHILIVCIHLLLSVCASAQDKTANIWCFGSYAGIDFNVSPPAAIPTSSLTGEGCSSISDNNGNLLFYTNGVKVFDRQHNLMPNGTGLYGNISTTQSALIVPKPGSSTMYYIFTLDDPSTQLGFNYSMVDMTLNGGFGDVILKNTPLLINVPLAEKLAGTMHLNGQDVWIAVQGSLNDTCYMYRVTPSGIDPPQILHTPAVHASWGGETKFSRDGTKFVSVENNLRTVQLMDFDNASGTFSNGAQITLPISRNPYGVEFSPGGSKLYVTTSIDTSTCLYQLDMTAGSNAGILSTAAIIYSVQTSYYNVVWGGLQAGPDNKVYISYPNAQYTGAINFPELPGTACGIDDSSIYLGGNPHNCGMALPNHITNYEPLTKVLFASTCDSFYILNGDTFTLSGTYLQTLPGASINGGDSTIKINLIINLSVDTGITQHGDTLIANQANTDYQWFDCSTNTGIPGATGQSYIPITPGDYAVAIFAGSCSDTSACYTVGAITASNEIDRARISVSVSPNPFSNEITVTLSNAPDLNSTIDIYNALGQLVYSVRTNKTSVNINTGHIKTGLYTIKIVSGRSLITQRIIK